MKVSNLERPYILQRIHLYLKEYEVGYVFPSWAVFIEDDSLNHELVKVLM